MTQSVLRVLELSAFMIMVSTALSWTPPSHSERRLSFRQLLPDDRLGKEHPSLDAFRNAARFTAENQKEYSLIVVTETQKQRILLGMKHRGFGVGFFNSFGGKIEPDESPSHSAQRELLEETGIDVSLEHMADSKVGVISFTFDDSPTEMVVHLYRIHVNCDVNKDLDENDLNYVQVDPATIRPCEEITPQWFEDWHEIPLNNMFADDSVWLTSILHAGACDMLMDAWFHFEGGGQVTNTILHCYMNIRQKRAKMTPSGSPTCVRDLHKQNTK